ncbi:MAG: hypothetical protein ABMA64_35435 [Myxococcota bacterium]
MNQAPEILQPDVARGEEVLIALAPVTYLRFIGQDLDSEELVCFWVVDDLPPQIEPCERQGTTAFSTYEIAFDPALDDTRVVAHLLDADPDGSAEEATVTFRLYLEGGEG